MMLPLYSRRSPLDDSEDHHDDGTKDVRDYKQCR
jgi:hypothetical protein